MSGPTLSVNQGDTSESFTLTYERRIRATPRLIGIRFDNSNLPADKEIQFFSIPFVKSDLQNVVNIIRITPSETDSTLVFEVTLN